MVDIVCTSCELQPEYQELIVEAVEAALCDAKTEADVAVQILSLEEIHELNRDFRNVDMPTDVLSFPSWEGDTLMQLPDGFLGDIAICLPRAQEQALEYGHSVSRELAFLAVHGTLHLLGYDHMEAEDEKNMREKQKEILEQIGQER